jgi:hypothetical protein
MTPRKVRAGLVVIDVDLLLAQMHATDYGTRPIFQSASAVIDRRY